MSHARGWLRGMGFQEIQGICQWIPRQGSCGRRPPAADVAPARTCAKRTDYRMSEAAVRQTIQYRPSPISDSSGNN
jgi:hypothetical protein